MNPEAPRSLGVPEEIRAQLAAEHEAKGTTPVEAYSPSREPVPVQGTRRDTLTTEEVAALSVDGATRAAEAGGADPAAALADRAAAVDTQAAIEAAKQAEAAQRIIAPPPGTPQQ